MKNAILILLVLLQTSCDKTDDGQNFSLPPITQTGENTFGCYIDGRLLIPRDGSGSFNLSDRAIRFIIGPGPTSDFTYHEIEVYDFSSEYTGEITIHLIGLDSIGTGEYVINESNCMDNVDSPFSNNIYCRVWDYKDEIYKYYCSFDNSGTININRFNYGIISGTFSCVVVNSIDPTDSIQVTEGRFDINGYTLPYTEFP